ncbi:hypothetical protein DIZ27_06315 [Streptomyces sp. NWU339]|nr:hypothetical protein DIZ27_06315 [Streptomyces sp. NWU339]
MPRARPGRPGPWGPGSGRPGRPGRSGGERGPCPRPNLRPVFPQRISSVFPESGDPPLLAKMILHIRMPDLFTVRRSSLTPCESLGVALFLRGGAPSFAYAR